MQTASSFVVFMHQCSHNAQFVGSFHKSICLCYETRYWVKGEPFTHVLSVNALWFYIKSITKRE